MVATLHIGGRVVGPGQPCFIIAEAGVNHNGDEAMARELVDAAAAAGADAVKFQTFRADQVISASAPKAEYQLRTTDPTESQLTMVRRLELSPDAHRNLAAYSRAKNVMFFSTPFDEDSVEFLDGLGVPLFKIGSGEITNLPLLRSIARRGKPVILSTGMSFLGEVDEAVRVIRQAGCGELILLHCVSNYPADPCEVNLRAMQTLAVAFQVPVGYSDHTQGTSVALAAVALGANVIEKHFTLRKTLPGPDHRASLDPGELADLVRGVRAVEAALGHGRKEPADSEAKTAAIVRRSLFVSRSILAGEVIGEGDISLMRPAHGLPPRLLPHVIGRTARVNIPAGTLLTMEMLT